MKIRRGGRGGIVVVGVACLAMAGSQSARAQAPAKAQAPAPAPAKAPAPAPAKAPAPAPAPVKLEYKFPEEKTLKYRTTWNPSQTLNLAGQEIQSNERKTVVWTQTNGKRRGDSTMPVEVKVESLRTTLRVQGGIDLSFDSSKTGGKIDEPDFAPLGEIYRLESQVAYTVVLDGQGKVKAIEGTEKLREKAAKFDSIAQEQVRGLIEAGRLKARFEQEHHNLPDAPVKPGESWERTEVVDYGGPTLHFRKKYEYNGTEKRGGKTLDKIAVKVLEVTCPPADPKTPSPLKATKGALKVESSEGTIFFDREAGCLVESRERTKVKGNMTFSGEGTDTSTPVEFTLQSSTQLQAPAK
ncbi:MAG: DUF6263 family protein [Isosphaeraceae bacterium]